MGLFGAAGFVKKKMAQQLHANTKTTMRGFVEYGGPRTVRNLFTGAKLSPKGKAAGYGVAGGATGVGYARGVMDQRTPQPSHQIAQPPAFAADARQAPTMGADGDLTLALSKLNN